jgi:hypothetical protein
MLDLYTAAQLAGLLLALGACVQIMKPWRLL